MFYSREHDEGRGTQCLFDARGGFFTVLHIVLGMTLKGRASATPYDSFLRELIHISFFDI